MTKNLIATFHDKPTILLFDADALEVVKEIQIHECLSLDKTEITLNSPSLCHESSDKKMIFVNIRIFPDDLKKISQKSIYDQPFTGFENCCAPG